MQNPKQNKERPAVYCSTWAKYNSGSLKGAWLYLDDFQDADSFRDACIDLHKDEISPELFFQDSQNIPKGICPESGPWDFWAVLESCEKQGITLEVLGHFVESGMGSFSQANKCADLYRGIWESVEDFAQDLLEDCGGIDKDSMLWAYFDLSKYARDLSFDLTTVETDKGVFIFWNN